MKVLQVLPSLAAGGAESFVSNLSVYLRNLGIDLKFYILGGIRDERGAVLYERLTAAGIEVSGTKKRYPGALSNFFKLAFLLRSWQPDIVQANLYPAEVACAAARFLVPHRNICFIRRLASTDFVGYRLSFVVRMMDRYYPHVIACSSAVPDLYSDFIGNRQRAKMITIPNGVAMLESPPEQQVKKEARNSLGIGSNALVVTHIGRMAAGGRTKNGGLQTGAKAHDVIIRSFSQTFRYSPDALLLLLGDGPLRPEAERLSVELGVADKVRFVGQQSEPWPVLKAADLFFFPSRYEGLPNVLPEAASAGLPVVASNIPEIRRLNPGKAWLLEPVDDVDAFASALLTVSENLDYFKCQAIDAAAAFREQFSMEACAEKYLNTYQELIKFH
ncbi:MAG: glycosyltransferase [Desulfobacteraceae bacterium]|nr:glycosyltransferase [Desulfobacteraceae bacterium]